MASRPASPPAALSAPVSAGRRAFDDRARLFGYAGALAGLNLYATSLFHAVRAFGWAGAAGRLFEVSAVIWFALGMMALIGREAPPATAAGPDRRDAAVLATVALLCLLPWHVLALPALILLGGYGWWTAAPGSPERRVSIIALSLAASNIVGRCFLIAFGGPIVAADARFVAWLAGVEARGNLVPFAGAGEREFIVGVPCSSVHNMSLGFILWATVMQAAGLRVTPRALGFCAAAVLALFGVNAVRLTLIAVYPMHFDVLHNGWAGEALGWLSLLAAGAIVGWGALDGARRAR